MDIPATPELSASADPAPLSSPAAIAQLITEHAADAIFLLDAEGRTTFANPAAEAMFGWDAAELAGRPLHDVIHYRRPDGTPFPMCDCPLGRVFATGSSLRFHEDLFFHRDGSEVPVTCSNAAIVEHGEVKGGVLIVRDVTERVEAERHRRLLAEELNHRVKNILAIVQSIARQSFRGGDVKAGRRAFEARLLALSAAHDLLTAAEWRSAPMADVVAAAVRPFGGEGRFALEGPDLPLPPRAAVALAMALHELATNATKYGALSTDEGAVAIAWRVEDGADGPALVLAWEESGGPPVTGRPARRGFGSRMIERGLAAELGGSVALDFRPSGLVCRLQAPLPS